MSAYESCFGEAQGVRGSVHDFVKHGAAFGGRVLLRKVLEVCEVVWECLWAGIGLWIRCW